ncbi:hypothetical protein [Catenulispora subtropica]|uniref:Secreted protein n=1 Tax=Catenulispora subtropica TaxID=450798 RepID=A0ABP5EXB8_9ACTN
MHESLGRRWAVAAAACGAAAALAACSHAHVTNGMDMEDMGQPSGPRIAAAIPADNGLDGGVSGYVYFTGATTLAADKPETFTFHITGPSGKTVTRFQPYEGQLLVFYVVRTDLGDFRRLSASMRDDGTWTVAMPALAAGGYRTYVTFAAPDSSAGTPLSYSLSQPLTVSGGASKSVALPAAADTATVDGYTLRLTGSPHRGTESELGVVVTKDGQQVQQFGRLLDGYAHLTAFHSGDAAFARGLSTGRAGGGPSGGGALTTQILFPESGTWRLFVQFETSGAEHTASFIVDVP